MMILHRLIPTAFTSSVTRKKYSLRTITQLAAKKMQQQVDYRIIGG
jgi:hypothetical protein